MNKRQRIKRDNIRFSRRYKSKVRRIDISRKLKIMRAHYTYYMINRLRTLSWQAFDHYITEITKRRLLGIPNDDHALSPRMFFDEYFTTAGSCRDNACYPVSGSGFRIITRRPYE